MLAVVAPLDQLKVPVAKPVEETGAVDGTCHVGPLVKVPVLKLPVISATVRPDDSLN